MVTFLLFFFFFWGMDCKYHTKLAKKKKVVTTNISVCIKTKSCNRLFIWTFVVIQYGIGQQEK